MSNMENSTSTTSTSVTTKREQIESWLNQGDTIANNYNDYIKDDPLYNSNKITQVLEEIRKFDSEYVEGKTQDLEEKQIFSTYLRSNILFLFENKYVNQLLASKSLIVRRSILVGILSSHLVLDREKLSLSLFIEKYFGCFEKMFAFTFDIKYYLIDLLRTNLDQRIGDSDAKTVFQKFSTTDISQLFSVVFLEEVNKKQESVSMELVQFLALNSLQNIEDTQNIPSLKSSYLQLLGYIFKYNIPETSKRGNSTIGECKVPLLFFINKYFGDSDTNDIGWKLFSQWTKSITPSSTPRKLINAIGILNSFGPESTLVKNHIDVILVCLEKIFFCTKNEGLRDMNTQCLNDIIKSNPNSVPLEMANRLIDFIFKSPGFLNNPRAVSEKGRPKSVCLYFRALFLTLNRYIPGCGIKYALDIANLNEQIPSNFIDEYFSGTDPETLKTHPKYEDFMKMFLLYKEKYFNSLVAHSSKDKLISALDLELKTSDYMKIIKKLKTDPKFSISTIKPHIEKTMKGILDSPSCTAVLDNKEFIIDSFSMDADVDFLIQLIRSMLTNSGGITYYHENNCNVVNCIKILMEINPIKTIPFIKKTLFCPITQVKTGIRFAFGLYRLVDLDDEVLKMLKSVNTIDDLPTYETQVLIPSLSSDILYPFYTEFVKKTLSNGQAFINFHVELLKNHKLELYGHNRVELIKIFYRAFLQSFNNHIPKFSVREFLELFQYIEPNDPFIQEFKSHVIFFIKNSLLLSVLELLVFIKSKKIKSLDCVIQELVPTLKINEKSLESKDINSVSTLTQLTIVRDIIKFYFITKTTKIGEILNLCRVSKLFLSVCQNLFRQIRFKSFRNYGASWSPGSNPIKIQTTPFSLAHKGIYHLNYENFKNVYHNNINEIFYQLSSLTIKNPFLLYEPTTDLNELVHLEINISPHHQFLHYLNEEMTFFKRLPSLESIRLIYPFTDTNLFKNIINQSLKFCPNLKEMYVRVRISSNSDNEFRILKEGFEMLKSHAANSGSSFKYFIYLDKDSLSRNVPNLPLAYANKIEMSAPVLFIFSSPNSQQPTIFVPNLKITDLNRVSYGTCNFFRDICPKKITFEIDSELSNDFYQFLKQLLESARNAKEPPRELTFKFKKSVMNFIQHVKEIIKRCRKSQIIDVFNIQHTDPTLTNTLELNDFSECHRYKLISPITGRFEVQKDYENESDISDDTSSEESSSSEGRLFYDESSDDFDHFSQSWRGIMPWFLGDDDSDDDSDY